MNKSTDPKGLPIPNSATRFSIILGERMLAATTVLMNSLIVARILNSHDASVYFFTTSVIQILVSPWTPAGEITWLGTNQESARSLLKPCLLASTLSATLASLICAAYNLRLGGSVSLILACAAGNAAYPLTLILARSKYSDMRRFVGIMGSTYLLSILTKVLAIVLHLRTPVLSFVLFSDFIIASGMSLRWGISTDERLDDKVKGKLPHRYLTLSQVLPAALSVFAMLVSSRSMLTISGLILESSQYKMFGLAFQVLNLSSFPATAMTSTLSKFLRSSSNGPKRSSIIAIIVAAAIAVLGVAAYIMLRWVGQPILYVLLGRASPGVFKLVVNGFPVAIATLIQGITIAFASVNRRMHMFTMICLTSSAASSGAFLLSGTLEHRVLIWALCLSSCNLVGLAVVIASLNFLPQSAKTPLLEPAVHA